MEENSMRRKAVDGRLDVKLAEFIKQRRTVLGLSQKALGERLGYRYGNFIAMIEGHAGGFPVDRWKDYADALEVPRHEFLKMVLEDAYPEMLEYIIGFHDPVEKRKQEARDMATKPRDN
jgi:hypothetical protein